MNLRTVNAIRYVTPLREGGSLPAIVEADDDGLYVLKFHGAGQGSKALIAELISGEIGRAISLPVPEIVLIELDPELARTEPDPEIRELIKASAGLNLALDYLPGSAAFDPLVVKIDDELASSIIWFDAYVTNVDRTPRNTNMLMWHKKLWLIDHGASLYFHHTWTNYLEKSLDPFALIKEHVLLRYAHSLEEVNKKMSAILTPEIIKSITDLIPDVWLKDNPLFTDSSQYRSAYAEYLIKRLKSSNIFTEEAIRGRK